MRSTLYSSGLEVRCWLVVYTFVLRRWQIDFDMLPEINNVFFITMAICARHTLFEIYKRGLNRSRRGGGEEVGERTAVYVNFKGARVHTERKLHSICIILPLCSRARFVAVCRSSCRVVAHDRGGYNAKKKIPSAVFN